MGSAAMRMHLRALLTGAVISGSVLAVFGALFPYRPQYVGPVDIVPTDFFIGLRPMSHAYNGPVVWIETDGGWRAMRPDELALLPYRAAGYPCIAIEQVAALAYFKEFGEWPARPTHAQVMHLCEWQHHQGIATAPCDELASPS